MSNLPQKGDPIIFLDIETLPCQRDDPLWLKLSGNVEKLRTETDEEFEARLESLYRNSALHAALGTVWMIGYAQGSQEPQIIASSGTPEEEKELLAQFLKIVADIQDPWWVGHNISGYDIPFMQVRALKHGLPQLARKLRQVRAKPWEQRILDTMEIWPRTGSDRTSWKDDSLRGFGRLDTVCSVLGIEQQTGVMGDSVYKAFLEGNAEAVRSHLYSDIDQVRQVFRKLWHIL